MTELSLLALLFACNGAPILARLALIGHFARPIDGGLRLWDGHALFGRSKTWRGLFAGLAIGAIGAALLGWGFEFGLAFAFWSLLGDLLASFIKRRIGLESSAQALGLDQLPEAALPLIYASTVLPIGIAHVIGLSIAFAALSLAISRPLYYWHIRKRPW